MQIDNDYDKEVYNGDIGNIDDVDPANGELIANLASGQTPEAAARAAGVCSRTVRKWVARFEAEGFDGLKESFVAAASSVSANAGGHC